MKTDRTLIKRLFYVIDIEYVYVEPHFSYDYNMLPIFYRDYYQKSKSGIFAPYFLKA